MSKEVIYAPDITGPGYRGQEIKGAVANDYGYFYLTETHTVIDHSPHLFN